jgi:[ribosomal protein S5]-alanine N-acetyltransferase
VDIVLTHPSPADADEFIAAAIESASLHGSWLSAPDTAARFTAFLNRAAREDQASYLIRHTACGGLVGYVNINNIVRGALRSGYLGYAAFRSHAGRGLMTAGLAAVITDAFTSLGLHRLEANIQPDNEPSLNLVRRLGFEREGFSPRYLLIDGEWRDHERWAMLADDWAKRGPESGTETKR